MSPHSFLASKYNKIYVNFELPLAFTPNLYLFRTIPSYPYGNFPQPYRSHPPPLNLPMIVKPLCNKGLFIFKYHKMKRTLVIALIAMVAVFAVSSCTTTKGGCQGTKGMVGYGGR